MIPPSPERVAKAAGELNLNFVVVTSVNRDDLPGGGSEHFAQTITALRQHNPDGFVEVLTPDFKGDNDAIDLVTDAKPDVYNHNCETIPRLYRQVRPQAKYQRSLELLQRVKNRDSSIFTKSGIMVGLGETDEEVRAVMEDLRAHGVDIVTIGQYPAAEFTTSRHHSLRRTRTI